MAKTTTDKPVKSIVVVYNEKLNAHHHCTAEERAFAEEVLQTRDENDSMHDWTELDRFETLPEALEFIKTDKAEKDKAIETARKKAEAKAKTK